MKTTSRSCILSKLTARVISAIWSCGIRVSEYGFRIKRVIIVEWVVLTDLDLISICTLSLILPPPLVSTP